MPLLLFIFKPLLVSFSRFTGRFQTNKKLSHLVSWFMKNSYRAISARQTSGDVSTLFKYIQIITLALKVVTFFGGHLLWNIPGISENPAILYQASGTLVSACLKHTMLASLWAYHLSLVNLQGSCFGQEPSQRQRLSMAFDLETSETCFKLVSHDC